MDIPSDLQDARDRLSQMVMHKPGVAAVGIELDDSDKPVIAVDLSSSGAREGLPDEIDGHTIAYRTTSPYSAFENDVK